MSQEETAAQVAAIRDALFVLGQPADSATIAQYVEIPANRLSRLLYQNGPSAFRPEFRVFRKDGELWSLTALGRRVAETAAKKLQ